MFMIDFQTEAFYKSYVIYKRTNKPEYFTNFRGRVLVKDSLERLKNKIDIEEKRLKWDALKNVSKNL